MSFFARLLLQAPLKTAELSEPTFLQGVMRGRPGVSFEGVPGSAVSRKCVSMERNALTLEARHHKVALGEQQMLGSLH